MSFRAYGLTIGLRSTNPKVVERAFDRLPDTWKPTSAASVDRLYSLVTPTGRVAPAAREASARRTGAPIRRFFLLYSDIVRLTRTRDENEALKIFETDLEVYLAERARTRLFVHAGVVGWKGKAILIPGDSGSGKSTLVAELVRAGATYYSDELAVLDSRGRVHPFPRPLSLRQGRGKTRGWSSHRTSGENATLKSLPVGLVVFTAYRSEKRFNPRRISPGAAVLGLLRHTVAARRRPKAALRTLRRAAGQSRAFRGLRGEAGEAVEKLLGKRGQST